MIKLAFLEIKLNYLAINNLYPEPVHLYLESWIRSRAEFILHEILSTLKL